MFDPNSENNECILSTALSMEKLVAYIQDLAGARNLEQVSQIVNKAARELAQADGATFVLRSQNKCYYLAEDAVAPLWQGQKFPLDRCISGWSMLNRKQVSIPDIYLDDRIPHDAYRPTFVKSLVLTPVRTENPNAAIGIYWSKEHHATPAELKLLQALADSTAVALEHVQVLEELEERVKARTLALEETNEELKRARDAALEVSQIKSKFVNTMTHELRTPVSGLISVAELLSLSNLDPEQRQLLEWLQTSAGLLLTTINDVLDMAKIEAGKFKLHAQEFELSEMISDAVHTLLISAQNKGLQLTWDADRGIPAKIVGDPFRLRQILLNLIGNAVKFTEEGTINVSAKIESRCDEDIQILFTVRDTGVGISKEQQKNLFQPFVQAEDSISKRFGGTGLGLSICKELLDLMDSRLCIQSEYNQGCTFSFSVQFAVPTGVKALESLPEATAKSA